MPKAASRGELDGISVLVTRPALQAGGLIELIREAGGEAVPFATLEIASITPEPAARQALAACDTLVFVSANAVRHGLALFGDRQLAGKRLAAIGPATQRALREAGFNGITHPGERSSTEDLLRLPAFREVDGRRVGIVRGRGGRETLKATLSERGAAVFDIECYERRMPQAFDPGIVIRELARDEGELVVSVTSVTGLSNLFAIVPEDWHSALASRPLVVIGERQAAAAVDLGWQGEVLVAKATDERIVEALINWRRGRFGAM